MRKTADFLVEFFTEEIPARMQLKGAADFKALFLSQFHEAGLNYKTVDVYVTPRRLALSVTELQLAQADQQIERRGPKVGAPAQAVQGFLNSVGLESVDLLEQRETSKGTFYFATEYRQGSSAIELIPDIVNHVFKNLTWPKSMRWGDNSETWVRPLRNVLCLLGGRVVPGEIDLGHDRLTFNNRTKGHAFMAPDSFEVSDFKQYQRSLEQAYVLLDQTKRKQKIRGEIQERAAAYGGHIIDDEALLDEVTGLVEWPVILMGEIHQDYMQLPSKVLVTSLKENQKYFTLHYDDGTLAPYYFIVSNIVPPDGGTVIIKGNSRVLNARLSDARFFYTQDKKKSLEEFLTRLSNVIFHADLGSMRARVDRLAILATAVARELGVDVKKATRAAMLSKADLMTEMVGEFANLQGIMGYYYAQEQGEDQEVAEAIVDHYKPRGPNDSLPRHGVGYAVALVDKIDTLIGFFAVGIKPTGSKDPFGLRRCALGVIRILMNVPDLSLAPLLEKAHTLYQGTLNQEKARSLDEVMDDLMSFLTERAKVYWRDQGFRHDCIEAVLRDKPLQSIARQAMQIQALSELVGRKEGQDLVAGYKRAANIVSIEEQKDHVSCEGVVAVSELKDPYEQELYKQLTQSLQPIQAHLANHDYQQAMSEVARLRPYIDQFFDHVTVNVEQPHVRQNRLQLLALIRSTLENVAQFDRIESC